ncbi:hypothetical protein [Numidum massiliense]|uniref:hypothetical protein n=1 Tax=Numidum massiliense TaxID=1522315 RepID=UPI0006D5AC95|nr:hypothetical protein [Numidum massiliense]
MLAESIIRIGRPIVNSSLPNRERVRWLTDADSENCKNYFQHVFLVELDGERTAFHFMQVGNWEEKKFHVDKTRNNAYPILYPQGGNPLVAQGTYPVPCYLMYDPHINGMNDVQSFAEKVVLPRLRNTVVYSGAEDEQLTAIAKKVADVLAAHYDSFITEEKQLGILYIVDHSLPTFQTKDERITDPRYLWITESKLKPDEHVYLDGDTALSGIIEAKFSEAKTLGHEKNAVSTFTNREEDEVASIYNKFWLWLSPTWEMPRSIYWGKAEWTRGVKIDRTTYEAYLYGVQFLKQITVPISSGILKEMFAPITSVEAKKHMKVTSFEPIFGVPLVLPLVEGDSQQLYDKYQKILNRGSELNDSDLHLQLLAGIDKVVPKVSDAHRLTLLYYSGDLSRGNMHIRMVIEDVIPTVAATLQKIVRGINRKDLFDIRKAFGSNTDKDYYRAQSLPSLLANAYGPGYVWSSLQSVFHRQPIKVKRLYRTTARKLSELANKEEHWGMVDELTFHYAFLAFYRRYQSEIAKQEERVKTMADWSQTLEDYHTGTVAMEKLRDTETLGFVSGLLLKQFSNSFHHKTGKDFVKHRVMKFGNKLTPEMIWKDGVLRCEELAAQWDMKLAKNFRPVLAQVLLGFLEAEQQNKLSAGKDQFMTAFWSGYLMYQKKEEE